MPLFDDVVTAFQELVNLRNDVDDHETRITVAEGKIRALEDPTPGQDPEPPDDPTDPGNNPPPTEPPGNPQYIQYSTSSDRSDPQLLHEADIAALAIYVFISDGGTGTISSVVWSPNNRTETTSPFDYEVSTATATALADTSLTSISATITFADGSATTQTADFTLTITDPTTPPPPDPNPDPPPPSGTWPSSTPNPNWPTYTVVDLRNTSTLSNFNAIGSGGSQIIGPDVETAGAFTNFYCEQQGNGDAIKPSRTGSSFTNGYIKCDASGSHVDIVQGQCASFSMTNCVLHMANGPSGSVTAHLFTQNMCGGGGGFRAINCVFNGIKLVGRGSNWGHDIRIGGGSDQTTATLVNVEWPDGPPDSPTTFTNPSGGQTYSQLVTSGGNLTTLTLDSTVPASRITGTANINRV